MSKITVEESSLSAIADKIRKKGGTSESLIFPDGFSEAVEQIETGITPSGTKKISSNGTHDVTAYESALVSVLDAEHFAYGYKTMTANSSFEVTGIVDQQGNAFTPKGYAFMIASNISDNANITNSTNGLIYCFYDTVNNIMRRTVMQTGNYTIRENPSVSSGFVGSGTFKQTASSNTIYNVLGCRYFWFCWG